MNNTSKENLKFAVLLLFLIGIFSLSFFIGNSPANGNSLQGFAIYEKSHYVKQDITIKSGGYTTYDDTLSEACQDTDGGINQQLLGEVSYKDSNFRTRYAPDVCMFNAFTKKYDLKEQYCQHGRLWTKTIECEHGCYDGTCLQTSVCTRDDSYNYPGFQNNLGFTVYDDYFVFEDGRRSKMQPFCAEDGSIITPNCNEDTDSIGYARQKCSLGCQYSESGSAYCGDR